MVKHNQKGMAALWVVLIVVVVAAVGTAGYFAYKAATPKAAHNPTAGSQELTVSEWGVKLSVRDAAKITYSVAGSTGREGGPAYEASAIPVIKQTFLKDKNCSLGIALYRTKTEQSTLIGQTKKLGDYFYFVGGSPDSCASKSDDQLKGRILADFRIENLSAK